MDCLVDVVGKLALPQSDSSPRANKVPLKAIKILLRARQEVGQIAFKVFSYENKQCLQMYLPQGVKSVLDKIRRLPLSKRCWGTLL